MYQAPPCKPPSPAQERLSLSLFIVMMALLIADNNLMAPNLTAIGREFGFSRAEIDQKLGADLNLMFWILGAAVTLIVGYLTDRTDLQRHLPRKRLLLCLVVIGQGACLLSGLASSYSQLYWARTFTSVGMGAAGPVMASLLADQFTPTRRAHALGLLNVACSLGVGLGQVLAGFLGPRWGWRAPFLLIAGAGLLVSVLYGIFGREPKRGSCEPGLDSLHRAGLSYEERLRLTDVRALLRVRTNVVSLLGAITASVPYSVIMVYLNDYLSYDRGLQVELATLILMVIGAGGILGNILSGPIVHHLLQRDPGKLPIFCAVSTLALAAMTALLLRCPVRPNSIPIGILLCAALTGVFLTLDSANPMVLNANPPGRRGSVCSLDNLCGDLGRGLGAWVVGTLAMSLGRTSAFHLAFLLWIPTALLSLTLMKAFPREQEQVQEELRKLAQDRMASVNS
jgi:predicted MFS family arabinose efflux permease